MESVFLKRYSVSKVYYAILFIFSNLCLSPLIMLLKLKGIILSVIIFFFWLYYLSKKYVYLNTKRILWILTFLIAVCIPGIYYANIQYLVLYNMYIVSYLFVSCLKYDKEEISRYVESMTKFYFILCIFAWIGFVYAFLGFSPILSFRNPDGRMNNLYLTTLSNYRLGRFIRPAGIYDEPGAFSFFICITAILRNINGCDKKKTMYLLFLGCITFSLTHFLITFVFFFFYFVKELKFAHKIVLIIVISIVFLIMNIFFYDLLYLLIYQRFQKDETTGMLVGDNRSIQLLNVINGMTREKFLFGIDLSLQRSKDFVKNFGIIGENPLSRLYLDGLFISFQFYSMLFLFLLGFLWGKNKEAYLAAFLLWLQRPYLNIVGYSSYIVFISYLALMELKSRNSIKFLILGKG